MPSKQNIPSEFRICASESGPVDWIAASETEGAKLRKFSMVAYTGGAMEVGFGYPMVVDLTGMQVTTKARPILRDHDASQIVGHTTSIEVMASKIKVSGVISGASATATEIITSGDNGFPWQSSIGARAMQVEFADKGETFEANGRTFKGPMYCARQTVLGEVSFVALGADDNTSASVIAATRQPGSLLKGQTMTRDEWLKTKGVSDPSVIEASVMKILEAQYEDDVTKPETKKPEGIKASSSYDIEAEIEAKAAVAFERIGQIQAMAKEHPDIGAKAIRERWSIDATRAAVAEEDLTNLRASRATAPSGQTDFGTCQPMDVIASAVLKRLNVSEAVRLKCGGEKAAELADKRYSRGLGLQRMVMEAINASGSDKQYHVWDGNEAAIMRAAASTMSLPGLFSNVANKTLLGAYESVPSAWDQVASIGTVSDFKTVTRYRLNGNGTFEKVGPDGELKHATMSEQSFTNRADTYGKMFSITRQDYINDDLGAFNQIRDIMGFGAADAINETFWAEWLSDSTFWHANNANLVATNSLSVAGLTAAENKFAVQTQPNGKPLNVMPDRIIVPAGLRTTGEDLFKWPMVNQTPASNAKETSNNSHVGRFKVIPTVYLTGTTWYMATDPNRLSSIEIVFLNGQRVPTIEESQVEFNTLGTQIRGYIDFGVNLQDPRASVKCTA